MASHSEDHHHVIPIATFAKVLAVLVILTILTVVIAKWRFWFADSPGIAGIFDWGPYNILVSMAIASVKAGIVALIFMHLKFENKLTWAYVVFPIFLIFVLMMGIALDNPFRTDGLHAGESVQDAPYDKSDAHH